MGTFHCKIHTDIKASSSILLFLYDCYSIYYWLCTGSVDHLSYCYSTQWYSQVLLLNWPVKTPVKQIYCNLKSIKLDRSINVSAPLQLGINLQQIRYKETKLNCYHGFTILHWVDDISGSDTTKPRWRNTMSTLVWGKLSWKKGAWNLVH